MNYSAIDKLMLRASDGNRDAFGQVALLVQDALYRFALTQGVSKSMAGEVTQETLFRAYKQRRRWKRDCGTVNWLYGIAINVTREYHRRNGRHKSCVITDEIGSDLSSADGDNNNTESLEDLRRAIGQLPQRQREAVTCRYLGQMDVKQTAGVMGCAEGTVKAATAAGLKKLKVALGGNI